MVNKISRAIMLVAVFVVTLSLAVCLGVFYEYFENVEIKRQKEELSFIASGYESLGLDFVGAQDIKNYRITLVDTDGPVLFDTDFDKLNM
ncbi:MAG: PAS domain-containing sensor histidine kinase, partial [Oscillospiraceae bacterium]